MIIQRWANLVKKMNETILFLFNHDYMYNFFKITATNMNEVSFQVEEVLRKLREIGIYGELTMLEERDYNGFVRKVPYLTCFYIGE